MNLRTLLAPLALLAVAACGDVTNPDDDNEGEVITTIELTFSPDGGGDDLVFTWADPEDDGSPEIDDIVLPTGDYALSVRFLNELEDPAEDITEEVSEESDEHQIFFTGTAVDGPAGTGSSAVLTHAYADTDADGNPVGLDNDATATAAGSGTLIVTLRHLPPEDGTAVKTDDLAETVADDGFSAIPGENDVQVTFDLTVE